MVTFDKNPAGECAKEIIDFFIRNKNWDEVFIYCNGKKYSCYDRRGVKHTGNTWNCVFVENNVQPPKEFGDDAAGDFLCMSYENNCILPRAFNWWTGYKKYLVEFTKIYLKYNKNYTRPIGFPNHLILIEGSNNPKTVWDCCGGWIVAFENE